MKLSQLIIRRFEKIVIKMMMNIKVIFIIVQVLFGSGGGHEVGFVVS